MSSDCGASPLNTATSARSQSIVSSADRPSSHARRMASAVRLHPNCSSAALFTSTMTELERQNPLEPDDDRPDETVSSTSVSTACVQTAGGVHEPTQKVPPERSGGGHSV